MINKKYFLIGGEWRKPVTGEAIAVLSPATEEVIGSAPNADLVDINAAVTAAREAFDQGPWPRLSMQERIAVLERLLEVLEPDIGAIAHLVSAEMGIPVSVSQTLQQSAIAAGRYFLQEAARLPLMEIREGQQLAVVVKEPVGVVASIAPWNAPFFQAVTKLIPALVSGCTVVFKPSPDTALDIFYIAEAAHQVGLPAGVLNVITGGRETGRLLVAHPGINKVSFTGSTAAGREIGAECGRSFKRTQLELGGKSAAIIAEDADMTAAMAGLATGCFFNTGQVCAAFSRVLAPRSRYEDVVGALAETARSFVVGDPFDMATTMGPLVNQAQRERVESYIAAGLAEGARLVSGGGRPAGRSRGWFIEPTVFADANNQMRIAREEIFGPVVTVIPYDTIEEAIAITNDSDYGLHGGIFTRDDELALRVVRAVRSGSISVNAFVYNIEAPFGGFKCSGVGRDTGREAVESYFEVKTINITPSMRKFFE